MTGGPEALDLRLPGRFRPLPVPRRVVVVKRKHGERRDRWQWDGDLVGTAGRGWRVVRHARGRDERRLLSPRDAEPQAALTLRWLGTRAPATITVKLDETGSILEVKVDVALPVRLRRDRFVFVDLDVDVVRDAAGVVTVRDWDTFESRVEAFGYTDASRAVAEAGESFGLALLDAWGPTLAVDVAGIVAAAGLVADQPAATVDAWLPMIVGRIVRAVNPAQIVLFRSRARGNARTDSDYDLLVIVDAATNRPALRSAIRRSFADLAVAADVVVATVEEAGGRIPGRPAGVAYWVLAGGNLVYDRGGAP